MEVEWGTEVPWRPPADTTAVGWLSLPIGQSIEKTGWLGAAKISSESLAGLVLEVEEELCWLLGEAGRLLPSSATDFAEYEAAIAFWEVTVVEV